MIIPKLVLTIWLAIQVFVAYSDDSEFSHPIVARVVTTVAFGCIAALLFHQ